MIRSSLICLLLLIGSVAHSQKAGEVARPKLVVGLVVDQMRWDFLYRYSDRYLPNGGFKRILGQGFSCENTMIPYAPTVTACGHTAIYTGSVPGVHGITGNAWYDSNLDRAVYCTEDRTVKTVGSATAAGEMSPRNMFVTSICDELRLATNFKSKVIGIAIKDRGGILPAGHSANGAYWYDNKTGVWITSTYYRNDLPAWLDKYNQKKEPDQFYKEGWNTLYPITTYTQSAADVQPYEAKPFGAASPGFPYVLSGMIGKNYNVINVTPFGNTMTLNVAREALKGEELGKDEVTDFLAVSLSSPDYVGHSFGPNSIEIEDTYLRLDKDLGDFLDFLDQNVGKGQYLFFISADHGVAHIPGFLKANKIPAGTVDDGAMLEEMNVQLKQKFGHDDLVVSMFNYQVHLNHKVMDSLKLDKEKISKEVVNYLQKQEGVARAFELDELMETPLPSKLREMLASGYYPSRSGDIQIILMPQYIDGMAVGTTHGLWNPYDAHIPLVWYGWGIKPGKSNTEVYMTDIAPTISALLHIQMPSGCVGKPITEITNR